ncbi:sensor domain-containing diguanylate cyclase [Alteromonas gilva]|uniref:Sensor domain-containing diguanylate cyclase n=1 Tax=Alteromonas gilva TaxID=2987522 RepID=A0ABT5L234_9ALTE|nr:sensor domain-containing diguanylate cyclase [Alteromonas gilva]MDC8829927.1 sensor domain-containing diguanylate cyclase [Alteromonas gilva]
MTTFQPFTQKLNVRMALVVALIGIFLSVAGSIVVFSLALKKQEALSYRLVNQLAASAARTAAIAVYVEDEELASEITSGLVLNDLVGNVRINTTYSVLATSLSSEPSTTPIVRMLYHPFISNEKMGELELYPDAAFIRELALQEAKGSALQILLVSFFITLAIAGTLQYTLSGPLVKLKNAFENVDPSSPDKLEKINIDYARQDELGFLIEQINGLIRAVRSNFLAERKLRVHTEKLEQQLRLLFDKASVGIALISTKKGILIENPKFNSIVGSNFSIKDFIEMFDDAETVASVITSLKSSTDIKPVSLDLSYQSAGERRWVHCLFAAVSDQRVVLRDEDDVLFEVIVNDITERKEREAEVRYQAQHDALTGLYNRLGGEVRFQYLLDDTETNNVKVFMMIDLDRFKPINDTYGHDAGDLVLTEVSQRIKLLFNDPSDVCCRWGGDEFVVGFKRPYLPHSSLSTLCNTLLHSIEEPIMIAHDTSVTLSASIGVVVAEDASKSLDYWLAKADESMYQVKSHGRANYDIV